MPQFDSLAQASAAMRVPVAALKLAKANGCGAFRHGRVDSAEFLGWWFESKMDGTDWSRELKKEQTLRERMRRESEEGELINFKEVERFFQRVIGHRFFRELEEAAEEWPRGLVGQDAGTIDAAVTGCIERIKHGLKQAIEQFQSAHQGKEKKPTSNSQ